MPIAPTRRCAAWPRHEDAPAEPRGRDGGVAAPAPAPSRAPRDTGARLRTAQLAASYRQIPLAVLAASVNAALMAMVLGAGRLAPGPLVWLAAMLALGLARLAIWWAHRRDQGTRRVGRWAVASTIAAAVAGGLWGGGAAWLWPAEESYQLLWVFVVGGMCIGAAALHHPHLPTAIAFILPAGLPIAARFALEGSDRGLAAAAMIGVFLAALLVASRRFSGHFREYLALRLDLARQAVELDAAEARLREEVERHRATASTLHHAQKIEALGQLTGGIAHDFNNLLMAVLGSLALLRKRLPAEDARALRLLDNAVQGANRGAALTQRLLAFGRRQALRPEAVDLPALVGGMSDLLRRSIGPGYRLETRFAPGLPPVLVDPGQLELAVLNLALNARDALPEGGGIEISARVEAAPEEAAATAGGHVVLAVTDHGEGMDAATLARAVEPFFTTKGAGKGTGLGLSMVQGLAVQSGGRLVLRSSPGSGTVAELWLRRAEAAAVPGPEAAAAAPMAAPARRLSVLVVDDDPLVLASAGAMLEDLGHRAVEAEDGEGALARLRAGAEVDLVITDYGMPGMSGLQLAEELRRLRPGLPVLLATGYGEVPALEAAGLGRLSKPFGQPTLSAAIEAAFARPG